jgi:hypothetical protein
MPTPSTPHPLNHPQTSTEKTMADCTLSTHLYVVKSRKLQVKASLTLTDKLQPGWRTSRSSDEWVNEGHEYGKMRQIGDHMLTWSPSPGDQIVLPISVLLIGNAVIDGERIRQLWNSAQWWYRTQTNSKAGMAVAKVTSMDGQDDIIHRVISNYFASQADCPCNLFLEPASGRNDPRLTVEGALTFDHVDWVACS